MIIIFCLFMYMNTHHNKIGSYFLVGHDGDIITNDISDCYYNYNNDSCSNSSDNSNSDDSSDNDDIYFNYKDIMEMKKIDEEIERIYEKGKRENYLIELEFYYLRYIENISRTEKFG
ncbi:hypothetical protein RFI_29185 [Reticulomyxa filosa]|uniref:Uncharacterized protein n=1 Tax=Reticulomyxa filosa TaxID=46433 RepID=X6M200_RETFI|nr:hypothetical protein RFI_29185 [Reticulomyxa filosa]|eukprot:ETO08203.1 hypothetical protein RFI_29185 [Reticulomyxa filosa]